MTSRRDLLRSGLGITAACSLPGLAFGQSAGTEAFAPVPGPWRRFELTTRIEIARPAGAAGPIQAWLPLPSVSEADWIRPGESRWTTTAASASVARDPKYGAEMLHLVSADDAATLVAEVASPAELRDRVQASLARARAGLADAQDAAISRARAAGRAADDYVHDNPWRSIGTAAGFGLLIGLLIGRR